jgi:cytochrome c
MRKWTVSLVVAGLAIAGLAFGQGKKGGAAGDAAKGKEVFEQCSVCHNTDTDEVKVGPSLKGLFKRDKLKNGNKVSDQSVRAMINMGGNGMPSFGDLLSEDEKSDVIAYLKTL